MNRFFGYYLILLFSIIISNVAMISKTNAQQQVDQLMDLRNDYIGQFRKTGIQNQVYYNQITKEMNGFLSNSKGKPHAKALYELATMIRIGNNYNEAIQIYKDCISEAEKIHETGIIYDAYIGIARSHAYGTQNHGAAAWAFDQAVKYAGSNPTKKQLYEIADYLSQIQANRGELESALINGLKAIDLASEDSELFYAQLDVADVLQKFAESCDYRKILDAKSSMDGDDLYGACKRAVHSAKRYYIEAKITAQRLEWDFLEKEADGFISRLGIRKQLIEQKASFDKMGSTSVFSAQDVGDVLVNENFEAGASAISETFPLGMLIDELVTDKDTTDPRNLYLLGLKADMDKDQTAALKFFKKAVVSLYTERSSFFDLRQQGTVVENRRELVRDLGLRLLSFNELDDAFLAFESIRAYGLSKLMAVYDKVDFSDNERQLMADLIQLESQKSALQTNLVNTTIAGIEYSKSLATINALNEKDKKIRKQHELIVFQSTVEKMKEIKPETTKLKDLASEVQKTNIPVIFYWITHTNVLVWIISPKGMEVKTVFLPTVAVENKVEKLVSSIGEMKIFDEKSANELYTYLIAPFKHILDYDQVIIVPQGILVGLPFETLKNNETGKYLAEEIAVSYAPNATFALHRLRETFPAFNNIEAIYDIELENSSKEVEKIDEVPTIQVNALSSDNLNKTKIVEHFSQAEIIHVLLHGTFDVNAPLQSKLKINYELTLTAAGLIVVSWKNAKLAVFSSCEGSRVKTRISNELFGISWVLIAGGVDNIVLSRWRVQSSKNAEWMKAFYVALATEHLTPALAANRAMRKMIKIDNNPYYWAGPQVYGR